jgi:hypothetical protein
MPLTIPPFVQYQAPLYPIAGRWNRPPPEGDKFIALEIDWGVTVPQGLAVQVALNSGPVEFSQIVAVSVDNGRNGGDVSFIFPDTGRQLTVPAYAQGVYPVFSSALTFYVVSEASATGDVTQFEILNSMPPPVSVLPSQEQSHASVSGLDLHTNGTTTLVPPPTTGTIQGLVLAIAGSAATAGVADFVLQDGTNAVVWHQTITIPVGVYQQTIPMSGLRLRFYNGLFAVLSLSTVPAGAANMSINLYYSTP